MGYIACFSGGSSGSAAIAFDLTLYKYGDQYNENLNIVNGVGGNGASNAYATIMQFTATGDIDVTINPFELVTNTSNDDGYFQLMVGGVSKYKKVIPTSTQVALTDIPVISLSNGDILECRVGFDGFHSGCMFNYCQHNSSS